MSGPSPNPLGSLPLEESNGSKQWTCIECNKTFTQSKLLETHAVETDHKAYRCTKEKACGKIFTLRSSWIRHERMHSAQKAHGCFRCGKKFHRKDNCHDHERTCGRVARRARVPLQSVSTPSTTSVTTRNTTPIDFLATAVDDGNSRHPIHNGQGVRSLDTSDASHQRNNGNDDPKESAWVPNVSPKLPTTSSAAYFSTTDPAPIQSRTVALQDTTADQPPEIDYNTLLLFNTNGHTTSNTTTLQPPADSDIDWTHWLQFHQSQDTAPSPSQQHAEEHWNFTPIIEPSVTASASFSWIRPRRRAHSAIYHVESPPLHDDAAYNDSLDAYPPTGSLTYPETLPDSPLAPSMSMVGACSVRNRYRPQPPSKIKMFFSKLKAYIKAPFRKHRQ